jgi:hypothetical protein
MARVIPGVYRHADSLTSFPVIELGQPDPRRIVAERSGSTLYVQGGKCLQLQWSYHGEYGIIFRVHGSSAALRCVGETLGIWTRRGRA